ncbi:hypothetical protein ACTJNA_01730 [Klebsiella pneumoniae]
MSSEEMSFISQHFTRLYSAQPEIKRSLHSMVREVKQPLLIAASRCLPAALAVAPGSENTLPSQPDGQAIAPALQPFGQQAQPVAGGPQKFNPTAAAAPEDAGMARTSVRFFSAVCTFAASPLKLSLISVIPATSQILMPDWYADPSPSVPVHQQSRSFSLRH